MIDRDGADLSAVVTLSVDRIFLERDRSLAGTLLGIRLSVTDPSAANIVDAAAA
jgi:hypothetical protein